MVLGFACLWFGMLVPVHQRGQIQLPGSDATAAAVSHCNRPDAPCHRKIHDGKQQQQPGTPTNRENCAVCQFIVYGLHLPPPVTWYVERLGLVEVLAAERHADIARCAAILPFHGRAPPVV
jgi:hypothetical protein